MSWAVVHFTKENSVEAVPETWFIEASKECFWPPKNYRKEQVFRLIQKRASPQCDWKAHSAVSLGCYDNFAKAEKNATKATKYSDISSSTDTAVAVGRPRKRKKNPKYQSDSSSRDSPPPDSSDDDNSYPSFRNKVLTPSSTYGPKKFRMQPLLSSFTTSKGRVETISMVKEYCATPTVSLEELDLCRSRSQPCEMEFSSNSSPRITKASNNRPDISTNLSTRRNILPNDDDFKKLVIDELAELNFKATAIMENLKTLTTARQLESTTRLAVFENNAKTFYQKITIKNEPELAAFEEWLMNESNYALVLSELTRLGGKSLAQNVRRIMYRLLTDEVALLYSCYGAKEKKTFKNLRLAKVILDSMKFQYKACKETEIIGVIKYWLVKAKERIKNKGKGKRQQIPEEASLNEEN